MRRSPSARLSASSTRVREYLLACVRVDTRTLAVFRVVVGLLVVADLCLRARNFSLFYTDDGVVPQSLATAWTPDNAFSVYFLTSDPALIAALFVVQALIAIQLLVGYRTRLATVLTFLFAVSLDHHNPLVLSYADTLFRLLLFWAIFLPLGERWSIDAVHRERPPRPAFAGLASAAIALQMIVMYVVNGFHKLQSDLWISGEAAPLVFGLDHITFLLGDLVRTVPTLLEYGGLAWFYMMVFGWVLLAVPGRKRLPLVALYACGHASFALTVRIGAFPYVALAGLLVFVQAPFWEDGAALLRRLDVDRSGYRRLSTRLERLAARVPAVRLPAGVRTRVNEPLYGLVVGAIAVTVVLVVVLSALQVGGVIDDDGGVRERVERVAEPLALGQPEWSIFAPDPATTDRYYVFAARTADGDLLDVYNGRELTYDRPYDQLQKQFGTYRERFYMSSIRGAGSNHRVTERLGDYLCETWAGDRGEELDQIDMYGIREQITRETIADPAGRERESAEIHRHACDGPFPGQRIQPPDV